MRKAEAQPKRKPKSRKPVEKRLVFQWDASGGAHVRHDERLRMVDLASATGCMLMIVSDNIMHSHGDKREGEQAVEAWLQKCAAGVWHYLEEKDKIVNGKRSYVKRIPSGNPGDESASPQEVAGEQA